MLSTSSILVGWLNRQIADPRTAQKPVNQARNLTTNFDIVIKPLRSCPQQLA
jgi:hypothetical protein